MSTKPEVAAAPPHAASVPVAPTAAAADAGASNVAVGGKRAHRAGRRPSPVWQFFTEIRTAENRVHARCNFCARRCAGVAARMRIHVLEKCPSAPAHMAIALDEAAAAAKKRKRTPPAKPAASAPHRPTPAVPTTVPSAATPSKMVQATAEPVSGSRPAVPRHVTPISTVPTSPNGDGAFLTRSSNQHEVAGGYTPAEAALVHRKLVLACVLHDVSPNFLEDAALREALDVARPGLPRLTREHAVTCVLRELQRATEAATDAALQGCDVLTLLYRHVPRADAQRAKRTCSDQWTAVDERQRCFLLHEDTRELATTPVDASCALCAPRGHLDAALETQSRRVAPRTVLALCCGCPELYRRLRQDAQLQAQSSTEATAEAAAAASDSPQTPPLLLGLCLLRQSLALRTELFRCFPQVLSTLGAAWKLAHGVAATSRVLRPLLQDALGSRRWDAPALAVKRLLALERDVRRLQTRWRTPEDDVAAFWDALRVVDTLMTPLSWMLALSEAPGATSAQYLVLWLWLLATVESSTSSLVAEAKQHFVGLTMTRVTRCFDAHELACMLLDPRVAGAGLSATGRRRAKSLVVHSAERVFPHEAYSVVGHGGASRSQLLTQLGHYVDKTGVFADAVAWEMSVGRLPELFWQDFVDDAPHLARVARALAAVTPHTQTATEATHEFAASRQQETRDMATQGATKQPAWEQTFAVRQIQNQHGKLPARATHSVERYQALLFPCTPSAPSASLLPVDQDGDAAVDALCESQDELETARDEQLRRLLLLEDQDLRMSASSALVSELTEAEAAMYLVDRSWFAFQSPADLHALEQAVKRFVAAPASANVVI